jgi:hypothetical protein
MDHAEQLDRFGRLVGLEPADAVKNDVSVAAQ